MQRGEAKPAVWVPSAMGPRVAADADVASLAGGTGIELEHAGENAPRTTGRQGPVTPYSLLVGANVDFDRGHGAMCELHLLEDVRMLVLAVALRF